MPLFYFMTVDPFLNYLATASTHCKHVVHKSASFLYKMLIQTLNYKCALKFTLFPAMPFCLFYDSEPIPQLSCNTVVNQSGSFLYKMQIQTPNYKCALNLHLVCSSALECITTCEYDSMVLVLRFSFTQPWIPREFYFVDFLEITLECQSQVNNSWIGNT